MPSLKQGTSARYSFQQETTGTGTSYMHQVYRFAIGKLVNGIYIEIAALFTKQLTLHGSHILLKCLDVKALLVLTRL